MQQNRPGTLLAAVAAAFLLLVPLGAAPALAASIRILVNDEPITTYDIQQRTKMLRTFTGGKAGEKEAIDQLIEERLMLQEAKRRQMEASDEEVDQEIANRARGAKLTGAQFQQALRQAGIDPKTFRQFLRANISWSKIVRARFRATVNITDQDIAAALGKKNDPQEQTAATEYRLRQILFLVPKGSASKVAAQRLSEANAFREKFQGCDTAVAQAGGTPGIVVREPIRRSESSLPGPLKEALQALPVGGATKPEQVPEGYQIVAVCAKNAIQGETEATEAAREELSGERGQLLARRYLRDLRSDAVIEYR